MKARTRTMSRHQLVLLLAFSLLVFTSSQSAAAWFLDFEAGNWTDIEATVSGGYNANSDAFTATGYSSQIDIGAGMEPDYEFFLAQFLISDLVIDSSGNISPGSTLSIDLDPLVGGDPGDLPPGLASPSLLLSGTFQEVQFVGMTGNQLEFLFEVTGGTAAPYYGGVGATGGLRLTLKNVLVTTPATDFDTSFTFSGSSADVLGVVPEPTSLAMIGGCAAVGMLIAVARSHRKRPECIE